MDQSPSNSLRQTFRSWIRNTLLHKSESSLKEVLEEVIEEHQGSGDEKLAPEERVILHNVLSFGDTKVSDIMIPRTDIVAVPENISLDALKSHIIEQRHTRTPVYQDTLDHVLGFLHVKDLIPMMAGDRPYNVRVHLRQMLFVPPSMKILDLLARMRAAGSHMAIVVDEHGGTDGLVTMEDVVEEIVGEIHDEHDEDETQHERIQRINDKMIEVSARIRIEYLEKHLGLNLVSEDDADQFDTLAGMVSALAGRVPARGEFIAHHSGVRFEVVEADPRRIHKLRLHLA